MWQPVEQHTIRQSVYHLFTSLLFILFLIQFHQSIYPRGPRGESHRFTTIYSRCTSRRDPPERAGVRDYKSTHRIACVPPFLPGLLWSELRCISLGVEGTRWHFHVRTDVLATLMGSMLQAVYNHLFLRRDHHQEAAVYKGYVNTQYTHVDANNSYVARSLNDHNVLASPSFINHVSL